MIAIIDYGMGNLRCVQKGFEKVGCHAVVTADPAVVLEAEQLVLPGVGAFRDCMRNLDRRRFRRADLGVISTPASRFSASASACSCSLPKARSSAATRDSALSPAGWCAFPKGMAGGREPQGAAHGVEPARHPSPGACFQTALPTATNRLLRPLLLRRFPTTRR